MDEQFDPDYTEISPWGKIPAIVDHEPIGGGEPYTVFESGAILMYLAEKTGQFWPQDTRQKYDVVKWLMLQIGGVGPLFGQLGHFAVFAKEDVPYAKRRYRVEVERLCDVLNDRLEVSRNLAGDDYSIADIATFPWAWFGPKLGLEMTEFPHLQRWLDEVWQRPAVKQGLEVP